MSDSLSSAIRLFQKGQLSEAASLLHELLAAGVDDFEVWHYLGLISYRHGDLKTAQQNLCKAIERNPADARLANHLGLVLLDRGNIDDAMQSFRRAIIINPRYGLPHFHLGLCFQSNGKFEQAIECYQAALILSPDHIESWNNQGLMLHALRSLDAAAECFEQALNIKSDYVAAISNLGLVRHDQRRFEEAVRCFERGRLIAAGDACLENNLGRSLLALNRAHEALVCFQTATNIQTAYADAWHNCGRAYESVSQFEEANAAFRKALDCDSGRADSMTSLGTIDVQFGRFPEAIERFREAIRHDPCCTSAWYHLSELQPAEFTGNDIRVLTEASSDSRLADSERASAEFALGHVHEHRQQFDQAFSHFARANELRAVSFDPDAHAVFVDRLIEVFSSEFWGSNVISGNQCTNLVFVVGMPRSGTTLVEQIIARHSQVHSGGELSLVSQLARSLAAATNEQLDERKNEANQRVTQPPAAEESAELPWLDHIGDMAESTAAQMATSFLNAFPADLRQKKCLVDKTPANFLYLGLIAVLFPRARVIHCRRNVLDTALSCYFRNFEHVPFSFDLHHIASYLRQYMRLMQHWLNTLPLEITAVDYEQIVEHPELTCRGIVDAAGLSWEPECLEFHKGTGIVQTASAWQVRQPIHARSKDRWRHYRPYLESLMRELGLEDNKPVGQ